MHKAASAFLTEDFSSRQFLALVVPDTTELWLIAFTRYSIFVNIQSPL